MNVFLDFEASSLADGSYPIEVAWVFEDGRCESHLIAPTPEWTDWDEKAEAIHGIARAELNARGTPPAQVAARMVAELSGHDLFASAPSWDGKWLSVLLRGAGWPRHTLRLRDTDEALRETALELLSPVLGQPELDRQVHNLAARASVGGPERPAHRALADAQEEYRTWARLRDAARVLAEELRPS